MSNLKEIDVDKLAELCKGMTKEQIHDFLMAQKGSAQAKPTAQRIGNICDNILRPENLTIEELKSDSPIEQIMEREFKFNKIEYTRKFKVGKYELDFAIKHKGMSLDIECDGYDYHHKTYEQEERDRKRDKYIMSKGWIVLRFTGSQINLNPTSCVDQIKRVLGLNAKPKG